MTVSFENTEVEANEHMEYYLHVSPQTRRQVNPFSIENIIFSVIGIALLFVEPFRFIGFLLLSYPIITIAGVKYMRKSITKKSIKEGGFVTLIGNNTYSVEARGLRHINRFSDSLLFWESIEKVVETESSFAFHLSSVAAFLIPKRAFSSPEQGVEFMRLVEQYRQQSTGEPIPETTRGAWWTQGSSVTESENQEIKRN
jgi:hypothetical protein